ncbi:hypothetical protein KUL97_05215 [Synechococcus sp. HK05]|uniref:hypothetical protein n=1 Tax=Synechococcus sp. HK05 TaxID=2725975 RepID=UPI001C3874D6|nr:hypothetical protein [Synechococcus sp. HK05]MBV2351108.1 hypothetical protein [Synechococcus sp. HK05]
MSTLLRIGPALLLALHLPTGLAAEPSAKPEASAADGLGAAFTALNRCSATRTQDSCLAAKSALEALIRQEESPDARLSRPRCLGALTHVETVLAAFRWRLENSANLQSVIDAATVQCTDPSATVGQ